MVENTVLHISTYYFTVKMLLENILEKIKSKNKEDLEREIILFLSKYNFVVFRQVHIFFKWDKNL